MTWSWISFALGYIVGGLSGILVLGIFIVGSRGESESDASIPPQAKTRNSVVKFDVPQNARQAAPASRQTPDQSA